MVCLLLDIKSLCVFKDTQCPVKLSVGSIYGRMMTQEHHYMVCLLLISKTVPCVLRYGEPGPNDVSVGV